MADTKIDKTSFVNICKNRDIRVDYDIKREIGSGAYGIVYEGVQKQSGTQFVY
jgi:hypothetical protein